MGEIMAKQKEEQRANERENANQTRLVNDLRTRSEQASRALEKMAGENVALRK